VILQQFRYSQQQGDPQEWRMETLAVGMVMLLVDKNASGKSRTLNVINGLGLLVSGATKLVFRSGDYWVHYEDGAVGYEYELAYTDARVTKERFSKNGQVLLDRGLDGVGSLLAEKPQQMLEFQTPPGELAAVNRRDSLQHSYFEVLHTWGKGVRHFQFGTPLGKDQLAFLTKDKPSDFDPRNTNQVIAVFRRGLKEFGDEFVRGVITDMGSIGYNLDEIGIRAPQSLTVTIEPTLPGELVVLYVKERDLPGITEQLDMSQGMFRALAVVIHLNYSQRSERPSCILIDDVGEGLDFDRSCALIDLLMHKAQQGDMQLIMSTNDRFVMNRVPLQYWSVIHREGNICRFFNYENSRDKFEAFKLTGMNNFDFFATDFVRSKFGEEISNLR